MRAALAVVLCVVVILWGFLTYNLADRAVAPLPVKTVREIPREARTFPPVGQTTTTLPPTTTTEPRSHVTVVARSAPTTTVPKLHVASQGAVQDIIRQGFARFGAAVAEEAVNVAGCETGGTWDPNKTGSQGEVGVLQIHPKYHSGRAAKFGWTMADLYDPAKNVVVAADLYEESGGWGPWSCKWAA